MRFTDFQRHVLGWMHTCFGDAILFDKHERSMRFIEEAVELVQAAELPKEDALKIIDWVYSRPAGEVPQEVGGVCVTLSAFCSAHDIQMHKAAGTEIARCLMNTKKIQARQRLKRDAGIARGTLHVDRHSAQSSHPSIAAQPESDPKPAG